MFKNSTILITGGTGSFGKAAISSFLKEPLKKIIVYSRDEKKQYDLRNYYRNNEKLKFIIGDIRDKNTLFKSSFDVDYIFHAAALKQVPSCEYFPMEAYKTNVLGAQNVIEACYENNIKKACFLSTDKAVYPINSMGISKAMAEKIILSASLDKSIKTCLSIVRYGNVMTSRGSVIPLFISQIKNNKKITITDKKMTRFLLNLNSAIELVKYSLKSKLTGSIFIKKAPSAFVPDIAEALYEIMSIKEKKYEVIGIRPGEKINETLISFEESRYTKEFKNFYMIYNSLSEESFMNFFSKGIKSNPFTYSSDMKLNLIDKIDLKKLLNKTLNNKIKDEFK